MRLSRPRFTIMSLMTVVVIASLLLTALVAVRERNRRIAALQVATAEYEAARLTRQVAESAVARYVKTMYKHDLDTVHGKIDLAEEELKRARSRLDRSKRMVEEGRVSESELAADEQALRQAQDRLDHAERKHTSLGNTKDRTLAGLVSDLARAKANELAKAARYKQLEAARTRHQLWW
jgi:multidrug resistance efflux pump